MNTSQVTPQNIEEYIARFEKRVQKLLERVRTTIHEAAPEAEEAMKYRIPTFVLNGKNLVHFAAFKQHIGFYPTPSGIKRFQDELSQYKGAKGSVQFPLDEPLPVDLIKRIVEFRVEENVKNVKKKRN